MLKLCVFAGSLLFAGAAVSEYDWGGDDTLLKQLTVNGPFAGVMFRW
jgi:hypothetical protein